METGPKTMSTQEANHLLEYAEIIYIEEFENKGFSASEIITKIQNALEQKRKELGVKVLRPYQTKEALQKEFKGFEYNQDEAEEEYGLK